MYTRNPDTGKWFDQIDGLNKDSYESLKQDLEKVRLYSKCLSGATYLPINNFFNLYDTLDVEKVGYYIDEPGSQPQIPLFGPQIPLNSSNANEFYQKYLTEGAFSIKNLFTPNKLIADQLNNYLTVDVATTEMLEVVTAVNLNFTIDGVRLLEGHRVLVKDQISEVTLSSTVDPEFYFTNTEPVSEYFLRTDNITSKTYYYYNKDNGIYKYTDGVLVREPDLATYSSAFRHSVCVGMGESNREIQYHLRRLKNGYYPLTSENQNLEFIRNQNWILRNRVDYNNIFDLNFYDIISHGTQSIYDEASGLTFSLVPRTIAVGEFGVIMNNQDKLTASASHNISNIINNKFKLNLRSICEVKNYYWICGDEGTLLQVSKKDYSIRRVSLDETSNFMSVSFFDDLNGIVVGKFNSIYWTSNGGYVWEQLVNPNFDSYSYNKVVYYSLGKAYIGGDAGVFIELLQITPGVWQSFKRKISRIIDPIDEFILVDDINDMRKTNWVSISSTFSLVPISQNFRDSLEFKWELTQDMNLKISISSKLFNNSVFQNSSFYITTNIENGVIWSNVKINDLVPIAPYEDYDFYQSGSNKQYEFVVPMPSSTIDPLTGNLYNATYSFRASILSNYDELTNTISSNFTRSQIFTDFSTKQGQILLISGNNNTVVCYDIDNLISNKSSFIYYFPTENLSDIKSISRQPNGRDVYLAGDKVYKFDFSKFLNIGTVSNFSSGTVSTVVDYHVNKLFLTNDKVYLAGNNSNLRFDSYTGSNYSLLDPTFDSKLRSRLLFLDYDVASKLNFFTDDGEYRLVGSVTFSKSSFNATFSVFNLTGEYNWLNYYKDSEKTFEYYTALSENNRVEFSTTFSVSSLNTYTFSGNNISIRLSDILPYAPTIETDRHSRYFTQSTPIESALRPGFNVMFYKYLAIFILPFRCSVGDVLRIKSSVIDVNLVVNKIIISTGLTKFRMIYCYTDFNDSIVRNLKGLTSIITITNLNTYSNYDQLLANFEVHPISIGYKLTESGDDLLLDCRFNHKTAYYNMQSQAILDSEIKDMTYQTSFLDFGYSPTYNILDYLNKLDSGYFDSNSVFSIMPRYFNIPGNNGGSFTQSNVFIDLFEGVQSGTYSWYRYGTNKVIFGSDYKFHWESLLLNTFIDLIMDIPGTGQVLNERMLINSKYYDSSVDGYVMEFHKKITVPSTLTVNVASFNFLSRNALGQISSDLQLLNNIQRGKITKSVQINESFSNLENELMQKFPTDSYFKVLASDYRIRKLVTAVIYTDYKYELAMNIFNLDEEKKYKIITTVKLNNYADFTSSKVQLNIDREHDLQVGDLIYLEFNGGTGSSQQINPQYFGLHTVLSSYSYPGYSFVVTSLDWGLDGLVYPDSGTISFLKKDPFLNYQPVDLIDLGIDGNVKRAIEIKPENLRLRLKTWQLVDMNLEKYRYEFVDGLSLQEVSTSFPWFLEAEINNAIVGRDANGLVWYKGDWLCGRWFGGTWYSGRWVRGDWYAGVWNAFNIIYKVINVKVDKSYSDFTVSRWFDGRWFDGTWNNGTWYNGRRYAGDWNNGVWYNGIWNDGNWNAGVFQGGVWVLGNWRSGVFNGDAKPSYWLDGVFESGDFENGIWYNGQFGNINGVLSRFGTKSSNSRNSIWHSGKWVDGEFHSTLNVDSDTKENLVSEIHKYSIWRTGIWLKGNFWGGIAYNIDFRSGVWHGGILEEIQVIGVDRILPAQTSNNAIVLNGDFRFNIGDEVWIIDDNRNYAFSPLGNNDSPRKYRINKIEELDNKQTKVYLNFNLSTLGVNSTNASFTYSNVETGLRVASYFKNSTWQSGLWTNGLFESGQFNSGIWYNGVFISGTWGL